MPNNSKPNDPLLSPADLGGELGIPDQTLAQWRWRGIGPAWIKVGKHVRYRRSDIDAWLDSQTVRPGAA